MKTIHISTRAGQIVRGRPDMARKIKGLEDGDYSVMIEDRKDSRSLQQNRLYWKWVGIIGDDLVYFKEEMHEALLDEFAPSYTYRDLKGKPRQENVRSSKMTLEQMHDYMMHVDRSAAELGVIFPRSAYYLERPFSMQLLYV